MYLLVIAITELRTAVCTMDYGRALEAASRTKGSIRIVGWAIEHARTATTLGCHGDTFIISQRNLRVGGGLTHLAAQNRTRTRGENRFIAFVICKSRGYSGLRLGEGGLKRAEPLGASLGAVQRSHERAKKATRRPLFKIQNKTIHLI